MGINFIADGIVSCFGEKSNSLLLIVVGFIIIVLSLGKKTFSLLNALNKKIKFRGFFILDNDEKEIVKVPGYKITEDMNTYLLSAFHENKAMKILWESEPLTGFKIVGETKDKQHAIAVVTNSAALFVELIEYCVINKLSVFLTDYFNLSELDKSNLVTLSRDDIPDVLLQNRFFKLFSEPMNNRSAFIEPRSKGAKVENLDESTVVSASNSNGALFERFNLTLPKNSKIIRKNKNTILIDMDKFTFEISNLFGGFGAVVENQFYRYYLGLEPNYQKYSEYEFNVELTVKFKLKALFGIKKWGYYTWIDDFISELSEYLEEQDFYNLVGWNNTKAILRCLENANKNLQIHKENKP